MAEKEKRVTSAKFADGSILEMVYVPKEGKAYLVQAKTNEVGEVEFKTDKGFEIEENQITVKYLPLNSEDALINGGFIKFPSKVENFESNQELFREICDHIKKYFQFPEDFLQIAASYVLLTWIYDSFTALPYLRYISSYGSGKSRGLEVIGSLCYKATFVGGAASPASIFRTVDQIRGTFIIDESDYKSSDMYDTIVKILNAGHAKGSPVLRMEPQGKDKGMVTRCFNVFGPKILASRTRYKDEALESRCITGRLLPLSGSQVKVPIHVGEEFEMESEHLRNKLLLFRFRNIKSDKVSDETLKDLELPRVKQSFLALVSAADLVSKELVKEIIEYAKAYEKDLQLITAESSIEADVLVCLLELIKEFSSSKEKELGIGVKLVAQRYDDKYSFDVLERTDSSVWYPTNYHVSPKRIGGIIGGMGIRKRQGRGGFFIPPEEFEKVFVLAKRYGVADMLYKNGSGSDLVNGPGETEDDSESEKKINTETKETESGSGGGRGGSDNYPKFLGL
ncbi:MAG: hypothetical protein WCF92_02020 [bacterium]